MKVLFSGVQPMTSPKQEKQNKPVSNQNSYSSHPQQKAVFSGAYPPNYNNNIHFGMYKVHAMSIDKAGKLFQESEEIRGLPDCENTVNGLHNARMYFAKDIFEGNLESLKHFDNDAGEVLEEMIKASEIIGKIKTHVETDKVPGSPTKEERNALLKSIKSKDKEYDEIVNPPGKSSEAAGNPSGSKQ